MFHCLISLLCYLLIRGTFFVIKDPVTNQDEFLILFFSLIPFINVMFLALGCYYLFKLDSFGEKIAIWFNKVCCRMFDWFEKESFVSRCTTKKISQEEYNGK